MYLGGCEVSMIGLFLGIILQKMIARSRMIIHWHLPLCDSLGPVLIDWCKENLDMVPDITRFLVKVAWMEHLQISHN